MKATDSGRAWILEGFDSAKGLLILAVVAGHNDMLMRAVGHGARQFLYNWHVYAFFLLTFAVPFHVRRAGFMPDRLVRYGVPYLLFALLSGLLVGLHSGGLLEAPVRYLSQMGLGILLGSADALDQGVGARLYWFLPALLGLSLLRWGGFQMGRAGAAGLLLLGLLGFLFAGQLPAHVVAWTPLGLPIAAYLLLPGLLFGVLVRETGRCSGSMRWGIVLASWAVFLGASVVTAASGSRLILASLQVHDLNTPGPLLLHALLAIAASMAVLSAAALLPGMKWLRAMGRHSLLIYLTHQFVYFALRPVFATFSGEILPSVGLYVLTLTGAFGVAYGVSIFELSRKLLQPRSVHEFKQQLGMLWRGNRVHQHTPG